jgi:methyl-accepting chemotaxis protein
MKLRTQLLLNTFFVIILFILSYAVIIIELQKVQKLQSLSESAIRLQIAGRDFHISTNQVFMERNEFSILIKNWKEKSNQFELTLKDLINQSARINLPDEIISSLDSLSNSASAQKAYRDPFEESTRMILEDSKLSSKVQFSGLHGYFLSRSPDEDPGWQLLLGDLEKNVENVYKGYSTLNNSLTNLTNRLDSYQSELIQRDALFLFLMILLITSFSIIYVILFSQKLSQNFTHLEATMKHLADRDLTISTDLKGSREVVALGSHINGVAESFKSFIQEVNHVSVQTICLQDTLAAGTAETLAALQQITKTIDVLEKTIATMEGDTDKTEESVHSISLQIQHLNENINNQYTLIQSNLSANEQISASVISISRLAEQGNEKSSVMVGKLIEGEDLVESSHNIIMKVSNTIQEVMAVTGIINENSDQTNILSMNASIESAHAGEAGKGFAVVAEEIRNLAESTSENSHQIDETLKKVSLQIDEALKASTESYKSVGYLKEGLTDLSGSLIEINQGMSELSAASREIVHSSQTLNSITVSISDSSQQIQGKADDIGNAVSTMKSGTENVSHSIREIGDGSREITKTMIDVHKVSEENKEGLSRLNDVVHSFKINDPAPQECVENEAFMELDTES